MPYAREFRAALVAGVAEPRNIRRDIWRDQTNADSLVLDKLYMDHAAVHRETPHFKNYFTVINDVAERKAMVPDPVQVG